MKAVLVLLAVILVLLAFQFVLQFVSLASNPADQQNATIPAYDELVRRYHQQATHSVKHPVQTKHNTTSKQETPEAPPKPTEPRHTKKRPRVKKFVVDIKNQRLFIYWSNHSIESLPISSGMRERVNANGIPLDHYEDHYRIVAKKTLAYGIGGVPMPWAMRFNDAGGRSGIYIHEGDVSKPFASHGCIRIPYGEGKRIFEATEIGTPVYVINHRCKKEECAGGVEDEE